jgi:hypothetical protein
VVISSRRARGLPARGGGGKAGRRTLPPPPRPGRIPPAPRGDHHQLPAWRCKNSPRGLCTDAEGVKAASPQVKARLTVHCKAVGGVPEVAHLPFQYQGPGAVARCFHDAQLH